MAENIKLHAMKAFYTRRNGLVELEDDVLSVVSRVREEYGDRVTIEVDPDTLEYLFVEHSVDGTDRLIFTTSELDPRALDRLHRADSQSRGYQDPYEAAEREQDEAERLIEERYRDSIRSTGEQLAHALKHDGIMPRLPLKVHIPRGIRSVDA